MDAWPAVLPPPSKALALADPPETATKRRAVQCKRGVVDMVFFFKATVLPYNPGIF